MTYDEAQARLTSFVQNPDTMAAEMPKFLEGLKADYETLNSTHKRVDELDERVRTLQDTNQRLFLMQTGQRVDNGGGEELEGTAAVDKFVADIMAKKGD